MTSLKIWRAGERSEALCEQCRGWRVTEFQYRTVPLAATGMRVDDVLVAVCEACDGIAAIPQQSAPRLRAARQRQPARVDARIPKELRDVVGVMAAEFGGEVEPFAGGVVRYYLRALREDATLARRVATLARSPEALGTPGGRLAFRTDRQLLVDALAAASRVCPTDRSALVRGILVAAAHDTFTTPHPARREALRAIAASAG